MVEVCGTIERSALPKTLWRPRLIGSSAALVRLSSTSRIGVAAGRCAARAA
jgi:hypothetical protein